MSDGPTPDSVAARYGEWPSPISADTLVTGSATISECCVSTVPTGAASESLWWAETRPDLDGATVLMRMVDGHAERISRDGSNVRTRVHEYGGGAWWVDDDLAFFVEYEDQRVYRMPVQGKVVPLTAKSRRSTQYRYADLRTISGTDWLVAVEEVHHRGSVINRLVRIDVHGRGTQVLWSGSDFVAAPRPSPDGRFLAWIAWDHPNMPWDSTRLMVARIDDGEVVEIVAEFGNGGEAWTQPGWSGDGVLHACTDRDEWWNLYRLGWGEGDEPTVEPVLTGPFDVATPAWVFGMQRWALTAEGPVAAVTLPTGDAMVVGGRTVSLPDASVASVQACRGGVLYIGAGFGHEPEVVRLQLDGQTVRRERLWTVRPLPVEIGYLIEPEVITFPTGSGDSVAHGLFYPSTNPDVERNDDEKPPLLVMAHGGPTGQARRQFQLAVLYWTSRGIAVVDVDYRGSSGYGRTYRRSLDGLWGVADVEDCVAAAEYLIARGDVDGQRVMIRGSSAGGLTVLGALCSTDLFAAGAIRYGVVDLEALATDTHKFESRYLDTLVGPWPDAAEVYRERSPIHHVESIRAPMIVMQGQDDPVVPASQATRVVDALVRHQVPVSYRAFPGEGHGFRQPANLVAALEAELAFFGHVLGFAPADELPPVDVIRSPVGRR